MGMEVNGGLLKTTPLSCRTAVGRPTHWNSVTTSSCRSSDGALSVGLVKLHTIAATGSTRPRAASPVSPAGPASQPLMSGNTAA